MRTSLIAQNGWLEANLFVLLLWQWVKGPTTSNFQKILSVIILNPKSVIKEQLLY